MIRSIAFIRLVPVLASPEWMVRDVVARVASAA
jgi:hypothetical protein